LIVWLKTNALTLVTATVALYGAVLSTLNHRHARSEKTRILNVKLSRGFLTYGPGIGTRLSEYKCFIDISNPGYIASTLRAVHLSAGKLNIIVPPYDGEPRHLPYEILPGQGCKFWVDTREIAQELAARGLSGPIKLRGVATDGTGNDFSSASIKFIIGLTSCKNILYS
jgi:hypothetical protein